MRFVDLIAEHLNFVLRCIYGAALILLSSVAVYFLFTATDRQNLPLLLVCGISILLIAPLLFFPSKIEFFSVASLLFSVYLLLQYCFCEKPASLLLYALFSAILFSRGYYRKHRFLKTGLTVLFFFILFSLQLRFGIQAFCKSLFTLAWYSLNIFLILFFYYLYLRNQGKARIEKILNLSQFAELTERDKEWLRLVQKETKYDTIAATWNVTTGTVKNRMHFIFDVIGVSDRIGFMATYGGFDLID